ncbi:MAG TPA: helix-turn-helix domain-containing protein [Polyangiaceae bacterium]|nr:helix-turn-helix domain-containing protein [Polyangiaceae bacterium]
MVSSGNARSRGRPPVISTERLLEVARGVFLELGIRATTAEVAARARIAEGTIFHRFRSKEELFRAAMNFDPDSGPALVEALRARAGVGDLRQTLVEFTHQFLELGRVALPVMMMSWSNPESQLYQERSGKVARFERVLGALTAFFGDEMRAGRLRRADPEVMSRMLLGSLHHFCMSEIFIGAPVGALTLQQFGEQVVDVLLAEGERTVLAERG